MRRQSPLSWHLFFTQLHSSVKKVQRWGVCVSLVPRPCTFVACSTKFMQKAWARLSHDVSRSLCYNPSTRINDVIDELAPCLPLKEATRDHSNGLRVKLPKC